MLEIWGPQNFGAYAATRAYGPGPDGCVCVQTKDSVVCTIKEFKIERETGIDLKLV